MAAAATLGRAGIGEVLLLEREEYLGGVLRQCIHDGFGLYCYRESLTGPEYARRWVASLQGAEVRVCLRTTVLSVTEVGDASCPDHHFEIDAIGEDLGGRKTISCKVVVCSTGCRERTRGSMMIPGGRPAGVMTAGTAQYMVNVANQMPGDKVAILGSGDIGLIMARRMRLEGADVRIVLGEEATGLLRNQINCIDDFGIPIRYGWGIVSIHGHGQLQGIKIAPMNPDRSFDLGRSEYVRCNLLLIACGLIPEREVLEQLDMRRDHPGLFVCGNANKPHDLVDQVSAESVGAALDALAYLGAPVDESRATDGLRELVRISKLRIAEPKGRVNSIASPQEAGSRLMVCTTCPTGCILTVSADGQVSANRCARGVEFARTEVENPLRTFTSTLGTEGGRTLLPVRSSRPVPRGKLMDMAKLCHTVKVKAPVAAGDVVVKDICGTGADLVATDSIGSAGPTGRDKPAPKHVVVCIDDTDDETKSTSTGEIAEIIGGRATQELGAAVLLGISRHQLLLAPGIKYTSHNSSMCFEALVDADKVDDLRELAIEAIDANKVPAADPGLCIAVLPDADDQADVGRLVAFGQKAKSVACTKDEAYALARSIPWVRLSEHGGDGSGVIGAIAGVGLRLSGSDGWFRGKWDLGKRVGAGHTVGEARQILSEQVAGPVRIVDLAGAPLPDGLGLDVGNKQVKPVLMGGAVTLLCSVEDGLALPCSKTQLDDMGGGEAPSNVCPRFEWDNDEEEMYDRSRACRNCLHRRRTESGFVCMRG